MSWLFCSLSLHYHLQFFHKHEQTARFSRFIPTSLACLHLSVYRRPIDNVDLNNGLEIPGTRYRLLLFRFPSRSSVVRFQRARRHAPLDLPRFFISAMTCYAKQNWNSSQRLGREFTVHGFVYVHEPHWLVRYHGVRWTTTASYKAQLAPSNLNVFVMQVDINMSEHV